MSSAVSDSKNVLSVVVKLFDEYKSSTPSKLKLVDAYMFCVMLTGIIQFVYCCMVGTFPFNAFLSGFISTVACFVLAGNNNNFRPFFRLLWKIIIFFIFLLKASYRIQINKANSGLFGVSNERAFADFIFAHVVLHLVVINFIG